jgi:MFS family permease
MVLFTCGCIIFATAKSMSLVIVGRLFMGLGGGGMDILESIIICDITTLRERALYIGINMAFCALGTVAGPILAGSLSELVTWRWLGWINLPLVGIAFALAILFLHLKPIDMEFSVKICRLDATGMVLYALGITLLAVPLSWAGALYPWSSWKTIVPLLVGIGFLIALAFYERKAIEPVFPYRIFTNVTANAVIITGFIHGLIMYSVLQYLPLFFQAVWLQTPLEAAISVLPFCGIMLAFSVIADVAVTLLRRYRIVLWTGWFFSTTFLGLFCLLKKSTSRAEAYSLQVMVGIGIGTIFAVTCIPLQASVKHVDDTGLAAGTLVIFRLFGALIGLTISSTVFNSIFAQRFTATLATIPQLHDLGDPSNAIRFIPSLRLLSLPQETMDSVIDVYQGSFQSVWIVMTCLAGAGFLCSLLIKELTLEKDDIGRQGLEQR